jgi:hypothetical protein
MQPEINFMELVQLLLQFAVLPLAAFMWAHYTMTQTHDRDIAVMKSEHALVKENHDREFKDVKDSLKNVLQKLDEIQKSVNRSGGAS